MKIKIILFIIFVKLMILNNVFSQTESALYMAKYNLSYYDKNNVQRRETLVLQIGSTSSYFKSFDKHIVDSLVRAGKYDYQTTFPKHCTYQELYKKYNQNVGVKVDRLDKYYYWEESWPTYNWKILADTTTIGGLKVQKALTYSSVAKENIVVWFCPKIPYSLGPGSLYGLPGLIIKVEDVGNKFKYQLTYFGKPSNLYKNIMLPKNAIKTTKRDFDRALAVTLKDPKTAIDNMIKQMGVKVLDSEISNKQ